MADERREGEWDFYFTLQDGRPASIFLDLSYEEDRAARRGDVLGWIRISLLDQDEHGMGGDAEAEVIWALEESLVQAASDRGLVHVSRVRTDATWELTFYGPAETEQTLAEIVASHDLRGRSHELGSRPDAGWTYYDTVLLPDADRRQWMNDRRIVDLLLDHGDDLSPRPVNHWSYFPSAEARNAFVQDAGELDFRTDLSSGAAPGAMPFSACVVREDSVEVDDIHDVVMTLIELAERHGGSYDGWETAVVAPKRRRWRLRRRDA